VPLRNYSLTHSLTASGDHVLEMHTGAVYAAVMRVHCNYG